MKICAVPSWETAGKKEIVSFIAGATAELVVLPGVSKSGNTPSPREVQRVIRRGVAAFVEHGESKGKAIPYLVTCSRVVPMPPGVYFQNLTTAKWTAELVRAWLQRTCTVGSRKVTFAICGEINAFNPDGYVKHGRELPFDILANPVPTVIGRFNHLGKKLLALSKGKVVIHLANNDRNHENLTTDVRIYVDQALQADKLRCVGKLEVV